jgi:hypothetical protein
MNDNLLGDNIGSLLGQLAGLVVVAAGIGVILLQFRGRAPVRRGGSKQPGRFMCWVFGHRWKESSRRHGIDLDHVNYRCIQCGDEEGGAEGLLELPKRPSAR